jgi:hypothetical protein
MKDRKKQTHGEPREEHAAILLRGVFSLGDRMFTVTDQGSWYAAICECGASAVGSNETEALEHLRTSSRKKATPRGPGKSPKRGLADATGRSAGT